jgi:DNA-binding transcriptional LysR family regulator
MMHSDQRTRQITDSVFHDLGIHFDNVLYTSNLPAIIELVAKGYGISFVHKTHLKHRAGNTPISCCSFSTGRIMSEFVAAYRKGSYISKYARDYIELIRSLQVQN